MNRNGYPTHNTGGQCTRCCFYNFGLYNSRCCRRIVVVLLEGITLCCKLHRVKEEQYRVIFSILPMLHYNIGCSLCCNFTINIGCDWYTLSCSFLHVSRTLCCTLCCHIGAPYVEDAYSIIRPYVVILNCLCGGWDFVCSLYVAVKSWSMCYCT